eukprot:TRINITY_DN21281_c0_g1_i1.p1 TRINITY_DN21281_c0_g1~~TRINITY_DN21281_c0_g1_i1.p1  ORF type:complete len:153 (+),score=25.46 TRINITY_DN21281_c0_g1_i1:338-796(+)
MKKRIRVTAIVSLDIVNEAPVAIDSTVQVQVPAATTSTLSISIPVDFQHFKAYDADFQKLRNDFELHHINLIDKVPIAVVGGGAGVVCSTDNGAPTEGPVSYTHLRAHETPEHLVCRLLLEKKNKQLLHTTLPNSRDQKRKNYCSKRCEYNL